VDLKTQWRLQEARNARNVKHLPKKAISNEQNQSKIKDTWAAAGKVIEVGMP
jgi:hypothetical protein